MKDDSRKKLADAIIEMSEENSIAEISVASLAAKAGVNRSMFYYYFSVPQDVIHFMMDSFLTEYLGILSLSSGNNTVSVSREERLDREQELHEFVLNNAGYIHFFFRPENYFLFHQKFRDHFDEYFKNYNLVIVKKNGSVEHIKRGTFYDYGVQLLFAEYFELLRFWAEREFSENGEDFTDLLEKLFTGILTLQARN